MQLDFSALKIAYLVRARAPPVSSNILLHSSSALDLQWFNKTERFNLCAEILRNDQIKLRMTNIRLHYIWSHIAISSGRLILNILNRFLAGNSFVHICINCFFWLLKTFEINLKPTISNCSTGSTQFILWEENLFINRWRSRGCLFLFSSTTYLYSLTHKLRRYLNFSGLRQLI